MELIEMHIQVQDYAYDDQIKIELPPEALQAKEMTGPPEPGPSEQPAGN
ncbi:MAG: hypothetical protein AB1523_11460 [Bacillota bacterium]